MATLDTGFPFTIKPINNITPFTYRDGMTYLELLYKLRDYMTQQIVPEFNDEMARIIDEFNKGLGAWDTRFNDFMANLEAEIAALNDAGVSTMINDELSETRQILDSIYVAKENLPVNIRERGAKGDNGVTDNTAIIQAAIDEQNAKGGGEVFVPAAAGFYGVTSLTPRDFVFLVGESKQGSHIRSLTNDLFVFPGDVYNGSFQKLKLSTGPGGGHTFMLDGLGGFPLSSMIDCHVQVESTTASIWRQHGVGNSEGNTIDTLFSSCEFNRPEGSIVPAWDVLTVRPVFNSVTWHRCRVHGNNTTAAPFFRIENNSGQNSNVNLTFDGITGEQNGGGMIHLYAANGVLIRNCPDWDFTAEYQDDIYKFASSNGIGCWNVTIESSFSMPGLLGPGISSINADDSLNRNILIINPDGSPSRPATIKGTSNVTILGSFMDGGVRNKYTLPVLMRANTSSTAHQVEQHAPSGQVQSLKLANPAPETLFNEMSIIGEAHPRVQWFSDGTQSVSDGTTSPLPGFRFGRVDALPAASTAYRGVTLFVYGGEGADHLYVCRNGGVGVGLQWVQLT